MEFIQGHTAQGGSSSEEYGNRRALGDQIDKLKIIDMRGEEVDIVALVPRWELPAPDVHEG